jgi:hypothetical protein
MKGWISCPLTSIIAVHCEPIEIDEPISSKIPKALAEKIDPTSDKRNVVSYRAKGGHLSRPNRGI